MTTIKLTKSIENVPPSAEIRQQLKEENRPVCVAFSGGKDALAAALALKNEGISIKLAHLYPVPGVNPRQPLEFSRRYLDYCEDKLETKIHRYPHPGFYRLLNNYIFQAPEHLPSIFRAGIPTPTFEEMWEFIRADLGLDEDTWVADGVRASDSLVRRASIKKHGAMKTKGHKVSAIYDWLQGSVYDYIKDHNIDLAPDYEWFGRSFDGIYYRFIEPMSRFAPDDYQQVLKWFPLAELELIRHDIRV